MDRSFMLPISALAMIAPVPAAAQTLLDVIDSLTSLDARVTLQAGQLALIDGHVTTNQQAVSQLEVDRDTLIDRIAAIDSAAAATALNLQAQQQALAAIDANVLGQGVRIDAASQIALAARDATVTLRADLDAAAGMVRQADPAGPIAIGGSSGGTSVSFAGTDGDRRLTGVADGVAANDAATVGQLNASAASTLAAANDYTDRTAAATLDRATTISRQMIAANNVELRRDMSALAAGSNALAGLPQAFIPGRGMMGAAIGGSRGETAFALGLSKAFSGDNAPVIRAGAAVDARHGDFSYNASVGFHF